MYARVTEFSVPLEKLQGFVQVIESFLPLLREQAGFQSLLVLKGGGSSPLIRVVSLWDSLEHLKASEESMVLSRRGALTGVMEFSKGFPSIEECEVLLSDFPVPATAKTSAR